MYIIHHLHVFGAQKERRPTERAYGRGAFNIQVHWIYSEKVPLCIKIMINFSNLLYPAVFRCENPYLKNASCSYAELHGGKEGQLPSYLKALPPTCPPPHPPFLSHYLDCY